METQESVLPIAQKDFFSDYHQDCLLTLLDESLSGIPTDLSVLSQKDCEDVLNAILPTINSRHSAENRIFLKWLIKHHVLIGENYGEPKRTLDIALTELRQIASRLSKKVFEEAILAGIDYGYLNEWNLSYMGEYKSREEFALMHDFETHTVRSSGFRCVNLETGCYVFWKFDTDTEH